MKFSKVEIQAFRAYDKVENGTFDFTVVGTNKLADFISIYAPNGFGKTSFYDAVEWGYTNNINRFLRHPSQNAESAKAERTYRADAGNKDKQHIIRNKYSSPDLDGFVRLTTTDDGGIITNNIPDVRSGEPDFKFKASDTKKGTEFFQDILLSQDWIDAFLKEDDATVRYEKFMLYFGDKKLDQYYKTLGALDRANESTISDLKEKLKQCQLQLSFDGDPDILAKINEHISLLNGKGWNLPAVTFDFSDADFVRLSNKVSEQKLKLETSSRDLNEKLKILEQLLIGTTENAGMAEYVDAALKLADSTKELTGMQQLLTDLTIRNKSEAELTQINESLAALSADLKQARFILTLFADYERQIRTQDDTDKKLKEELRVFTEKMNTLEVTKSRLQQAKHRLDNVLREIDELRQQRVDVHQLDALNLALTGEQKLLQTELATTVNHIAQEVALINRLEIERQRNEQALTFLDAHQFSLITIDLAAGFQDAFTSAARLLQTKGQALAELDKIQVSIKSQETLNAQLQEFIMTGSTLVEQLQSDHCPLCNTDFESFQNLKNAVLNNSALNTATQTLLALKTTKENEIKNIDTEIAEGLLLANDTIRTTIANINNKLKIEGDAVAGLRVKEDEISGRLQRVNQQILDLSTRLNGLTPEHFNSLKEEAIVLLRDELANLQKAVSDFEAGIAEKEKEISAFRSVVLGLEEFLKQAKENYNYKTVDAYFSQKYPGQVVAKGLLNEAIAKMDADIRELRKIKSQHINVIEAFDKNNPGVQSTSLEATIAGRERINNDLQRKLIRFEQTGLNELQLSFSKDITVESLEELLKTKNDELQKSIQINNDDLQKLELLELLQSNVRPFLTYQRVVQTADELTARIKILKDKVHQALAAERSRVSAFINAQVESFFYEDLINVLYRKIDPHPEYKKIKFQCDFSNDKPRLNVFVTGENGDNPLVPNLYFSTAQMNILSLSIFLAKALNAEDNKKPVDCIFIDDPIQSMDSINILSTIDLLRSIVIKFKKQIIISTHDENFHNLLKKKIPDNLFNARYIELETFGTVKAN